MPIDTVRQRVADLIGEQSLAPEDEDKWIRQASEMRKTLHTANPYAGQASTSNGASTANADSTLTVEEVKAMLHERERNMQKQVSRH